MFDTSEWESAVAAGDPAARLRADLSELALDDCTDWAGDALSERLVELVEVRERLDAELARTTAVWHRKRAWEADGSLTPAAWLTYRVPLARSDAALLVKMAEVVSRSPRLAAALHAGETTTAHVAALAKVMSPRRRTLLEDHEVVLTNEAVRLSIADFTLVARRWAALADDALATDDHDETHPRNELHAAVTIDGWLDLKGHLDPIAGAGLLETLDHLAPPDPLDAPDGARGLAERRGDALADLAAQYQRGAAPTGNPPSLDVVVDVATLNGATPELARRRCDLEGIGPITRATLDQLACGATLRRLVMAGDSVILDMGRKARLATAAQTRAIRIRDSGCIFPSCGRPARWCDIHHIDGFAIGGHTDVARMVCLCRRHHTLIHNSKWTIEINPDATFRVTHPARAALPRGHPL